MENLTQLKIDIDYTLAYVSDKPKLKEIESIIRSINYIYIDDNRNFICLAYYVFRLKELFYDVKYITTKKANELNFKSIIQQLGLSESEISRLCKSYEKYHYMQPNGNIVIQDNFNLFNKSKLIELLAVPNEQILQDINNKVLRGDMTVLSIRKYVKNYKELEKQNNKIENEQEEKEEEFNIEDIPECYNPKKQYEFNYFETKTKSQLLNIVWELQKEYQKLKNKKDKK